jgi:hypothetical protein
MVMNGLRMFTRPDLGGSVENVFYSQREHGPVYRWQYEKHLASWQAARIDVSDWGSHELCNVRWQTIPQELQARLSEHYIE